jgi:hypothetical protein
MFTSSLESYKTINATTKKEKKLLGLIFQFILYQQKCKANSIELLDSHTHRHVHINIYIYIFTITTVKLGTPVRQKITSSS